LPAKISKNRQKLKKNPQLFPREIFIRYENMKTHKHSRGNNLLIKKMLKNNGNVERI